MPEAVDGTAWDPLGDGTVTRDDIRKLIGGYATGSLTESERKLLFDAALEDQDLFDELAREQALKDLLEEPGVKQRLLTALSDAAPRQVAWWRKPLVWSAAGALAAAVAGLSWLLYRPASAPVQIAQVESRPAPAQIAPTQPSAEPSLQKKKTEPGPVTPARETAIRARDQEQDAKREPEANQVAAAPPPAPAAAAPASPAGQQQLADSQIRKQQAPIQPYAQQNQRSTSSQGAVGGTIAELRRAVPAPAKFAFDYALEDSTLVLKFAADGYISIHFSPGLDTIVDSRVAAGSTRREPIPNNATEAAIVFSAAPQSTSGGVDLTRGDRAGSVNDPSGTRIELLLKFYP